MGSNVPACLVAMTSFLFGYLSFNLESVDRALMSYEVKPFNVVLLDVHILPKKFVNNFEA